MPNIVTAEAGEIFCSHELVATTMEEISGTLPHGFLDSDGNPTTYSFNPPTMGTQKKLGALRGRKDLLAKPGKMTTYWLATALSSLGDDDLNSMKLDKAALLVSKLTAGDVLFLLFAWQAMNNPDGLPLTATGCGVCGENFDHINVDLGTMEILRLPRKGDCYDEEHELAGEPMEVPTASNPPRARVGLKQGLPAYGETIKTALVGPPSWVETIYKIGRGQMHNSVLLQCLTYGSSIVGTDHSKLSKLPIELLDELWPADASLLDEAAGKVSPGPLLEVEVECPRETCGAVNRTVLNWQDPLLFSSSTAG